MAHAVDPQCALELSPASPGDPGFQPLAPAHAAERLSALEREELVRLRHEVRHLRAEREIRRILTTCLANARPPVQDAPARGSRVRARRASRAS